MILNIKFFYENKLKYIILSLINILIAIPMILAVSSIFY